MPEASTLASHGDSSIATLVCGICAQAQRLTQLNAKRMASGYHPALRAINFRNMGKQSGNQLRPAEC